MPRRSTGCERCRQRKIRCDEQRPDCQNCITYGVKCTGYRPPAEKDLRFVVQSNRSYSQFDVESRGRTQVGYVRGLEPKHLQWRHTFAENTAPGPTKEISKVSVHRAQLLNTFLGLYLPKERDDSMTSNFGYLISLPQLDISSQLLQLSIDVLCLLEIGSLYQDERCLREARTLYVRSLHMLSRELARSKSKQVRSDHMMAAITILALCELFDPLANNNQKRQGWLSHIEGATQYFRYNRAECLASPFGRLLFHNVRHSALSIGFAKRKAVIFAETEWLHVTKELSRTDPYVALYDLAVQIPGLLERADMLSSNPETAEDQERVLADIWNLRQELAGWPQKYHCSITTAPYKIVNVRDMESFAHLCLDRTFQTVFHFRNVQICNQMQLYWISCLILDCTLLDARRRLGLIDNNKHVLGAHLTNRSNGDLQRGIFVTATNFCRSIPYCCEPETGSVSRMGNFYLSAVEKYVEHYGYCNELEWCKSVRRIFAATSVMNNASDREEDSKVRMDTAQANIEHRCKSPICNFRVECCAPAPLLTADEFPDVEHMHVSQ